MRGICGSLVFIVPSSLAMLLYSWSMNSGTLARDLGNGKRPSLSVATAGSFALETASTVTKQRTVSARAQMMYKLEIMMAETSFCCAGKLCFSTAEVAFL